MSATFNSAGTKILGLRKKLPPVLYDVSSPVKVGWSLDCSRDVILFYLKIHKTISSFLSSRGPSSTRTGTTTAAR